ncbi:hypothetical protein [Saliphagus infecundisoli]|uniref:Uncharacterized protein n=1 Tax=Saliphagus infecundisoli TaxID=1849069 RepID=A0ABD5Q9F6_9EURY|nr:hypothetical protein [Saliphagus infecundisoli]
MPLTLLQSIVSDLDIVSAYLSQHIPIYTYGRLMEIGLSHIFVALVVYALLLFVLFTFRVIVGSILIPSWTPFPRRGDGVVVGVVAPLAAIVAIDFLQFAGVGS